MENKALLPKWFREFPGVEWIVISGKKLPVLDDRYRVTLDIKGKKLIGSALGTGCLRSCGKGAIAGDPLI
ncbi:type IV toxin-antitoxin system AbiEi family antitoxin domain-containing protein [Klebsiella pneumoniae]|nr:type IV toxin-antitoxin system AbiEi family antitoxin domain-containing protein [Klebsiella pneumoniae]